MENGNLLNVQEKQNKLLQLCTFCRVLPLQKTRDNLYQTVGLVAMNLFMMIPALDLLVVHLKQKMAHLPSSKSQCRKTHSSLKFVPVRPELQLAYKALVCAPPLVLTINAKSMQEKIWWQT